jgi:outer membrane protein assembly factor BamE (lipoprotein component of BamABCDE complex)
MLFAFTFFLGWIALNENIHPIDPYIDTCFAPDYSPEKFNDIKIGMTLDEVELIIGKPLYSYYVYDDSTKINYDYTCDGKLLSKAQQKGKRNYYDCAWYRSSIIIDMHNIVIEIDKGWSYD